VKRRLFKRRVVYHLFRIIIKAEFGGSKQCSSNNVLKVGGSCKSYLRPKGFAHCAANATRQGRAFSIVGPSTMLNSLRPSFLIPTTCCTIAFQRNAAANRVSDVGCMSLLFHKKMINTSYRAYSLKILFY